MSLAQCELIMNCSCGKEISSPKLTGELCTSCYFQNQSKRPKVEELIINDNKPNDNITSNNLPTQYDESNNDIEIEEKDKLPPISKEREIKREGIKYCQSCIERGYGLVLATREWRADYFICDDCFTPLINQMMDYDTDRVEIEKISAKIDPNKPFLNQAYELLGIPEQLRFTTSDLVLRARNDIFNFHSIANVNKSIEEIAGEIEELAIILFQIKLKIEPKQDYINKLKAKEREEAGLRGLDKSEKEYTKWPSKVRMGKDENMAKQLGMSLEKYLEMIKSAKTMEFNKIVNS